MININGQDVATRVRRTFGDEAAVQVSDEDIVRWINDAQIELVKRNETVLQTTGTANIVAGTAAYSLPADLLILRSVRYKYDDMTSFVSLKYANLQEFDDTLNGWDGTLFTNANPKIFTRYADTISLFPTPDQSATGGLKYLYSTIPTDITDLTDALSLPLIYHTTIVNYCLWQASLLDEDYDPSQLHKAYLDESVNNLIALDSMEQTEYYPKITVLEDDM